MAAYTQPWRDDEKIQLLLNIIESSSIKPDFAKVKPPKGRDQKACEAAFQAIKDAPSISSFTPANAGSLKRSRDDTEDATGTSILETPAKKKRGRPPKAGGPTEKKALAAAWAAQTGLEIPKKKRGRPPKVRTEAPADAKNGPTDTPTKRGRGRPTKAEAAAKQAAKNTQQTQAHSESPSQPIKPSNTTGAPPSPSPAETPISSPQATKEPLTPSQGQTKPRANDVKMQDAPATNSSSPDDETSSSE